MNSKIHQLIEKHVHNVICRRETFVKENYAKFEAIEIKIYNNNNFGYFRIRHGIYQKNIYLKFNKHEE